MRAPDEKYSAAAPEDLKAKEISGGTQTHVMVIDVGHITGKEAIEYIRARQT